MRAVAQGLTAILERSACVSYSPCSLANMTQPLDHFDEELDVGGATAGSSASYSVGFRICHVHETEITAAEGLGHG